MDLISIVLRFEVGAAFIFFSYPTSLFLGIAFSITNELAVKYYRIKSSIFKKASILTIFAFVNTLIFADGAFFKGNFIMNKGTEQAFVNYENIKWYIQGVFCFALAIVLLRMLFLGITILIQRCSSNKNTAIPAKNSIRQ